MNIIKIPPTPNHQSVVPFRKYIVYAYGCSLRIYGWVPSRVSIHKTIMMTLTKYQKNCYDDPYQIPNFTFVAILFSRVCGYAVNVLWLSRVHEIHSWCYAPYHIIETPYQLYYFLFHPFPYYSFLFHPCALTIYGLCSCLSIFKLVSRSFLSDSMKL